MAKKLTFLRIPYFKNFCGRLYVQLSPSTPLTQPITAHLFGVARYALLWMLLYCQPLNCSYTYLDLVYTQFAFGKHFAILPSVLSSGLLTIDVEVISFTVEVIALCRVERYAVRTGCCIFKNARCCEHVFFNQML